jgi:hypothetical protein
MLIPQLHTIQIVKLIEQHKESETNLLCPFVSLTLKKIKERNICAGSLMSATASSLTSQSVGGTLILHSDEERGNKPFEAEARLNKI